ncbi:adenylate/guanylate cyclase domain-containing protein [Methylobacterium sp. NEAU 140]|uniref:DUF6719 family protein n=1 Tax=Methylobacterium sp. NEAU 140 TaxID=3064945 RepID=UPI002735371B|nr:adenylate/guanylate cyclase domain-containing protein [Methylobacterium sp. NEAU 140]MDP4026369.1 adenylate/guanylate cyclase domain-containing protein [Methylobacterium sp. NEAU 140]
MNATVQSSSGEVAPSNGGIADPMVPDRATRTLRTIFAADVVGYSRHMAEAEADTIAALACHRRVVDGVIARWDGRIFTTAGDSVVADFGSPSDAVRCAIDVQAAIRALHERAVAARRLAFRIGLHTGDVMRRGDSILGDAVNVAARLESLARPGGLLISREVRDFLDPDLARVFVPRGRGTLKEVGRTIEAYELPDGPTPRWVKLRRELLRQRWIAAAVVGIAAFSYVFAAYDGVAFLSVGIGYRMAPTDTVFPQDPPPGWLTPGQRVLVDDGSCPAGQIKAVSGGNMTLALSRGQRCVPHP